MIGRHGQDEPFGVHLGPDRQAGLINRQPGELKIDAPSAQGAERVAEMLLDDVQAAGRPGGPESVQ